MKRFQTLLGLGIFLVLCSILWALVPSGVEGAIPQLMNVQGILRQPSGSPVPNASYSVTFKIYNSGGIALWTEGPRPVVTDSGSFSVLLGAVTPIPDSVFKDTTRYLGITVSPDAEMTPRSRLSSVAYSNRVGSVDGASGGDVFGDLTLHSTITATNVVVGDPAHVIPIPGILKVYDSDGPFFTVDGVTRKVDITGTGVVRPRINSDINAGLGLALGNSPKWSVATVSGGAFQIYNENPAFPGERNRFFIDTSGNVGIGTSHPADTGMTPSPGIILHIVDTLPTHEPRIVIEGEGSGGKKVAAILGDGKQGINSVKGILQLYEEGISEVFLNTDQAMGPSYINTGGKLGIGTSTPSFKLDVAPLDSNCRLGRAEIGAWPANRTFFAYFGNEALDHTVAGNFALAQHNNGTTILNAASGTQINFRINNNDKMILDPVGNVGIGTTGPGFLLEVNGSAGKPGGGSWSASSDIRLKKNVRPLEGALDNLLKLRGVTYQWKEPEKEGNMRGTYMGMIAQEVEPVFPEWVGTKANGYKTLTFIGFEALSVEAIRELNQTIRNQADEISELKAKVGEMAELRAQVCELQNLLQTLLVQSQNRPTDGAKMAASSVTAGNGTKTDGKER